MHKSKFIIFFIFFSISLFSQELDENFLDSLPDDIRKDVLERADEQDKSTDENYRPYQYSSKLQQAEELISLKKRLETDLEELEKRLSSDENLRLGEDLKLFGSNFLTLFRLLLCQSMNQILNHLMFLILEMFLKFN